ncbi:uncharacterized protein LOC128192132 isoform X1 [Crassostrea angulata]|uniref:uncharacterized protein LOC128192132 isoform X1 n=1 Tax=Magallana angulata TaxID=2784310 RepID=UPI0022B1AF17|nr:uncharacterized protein LOC128192132 isoform X1 [Crassostrea angulata]
MDIVPFILWNHLVKNCQTFENLAVLPRILWYAWQAIPPSPRGHFRSTCYIELTPTDVRGDQVMGSFEISLEDYCRIKIEDFHREQLFSAERRNVSIESIFHYCIKGNNSKINYCMFSDYLLLDHKFRWLLVHFDWNLIIT